MTIRRFLFSILWPLTLVSSLALAAEASLMDIFLLEGVYTSGPSDQLSKDVTLKMDEASLVIVTNASFDIDVYRQYDVCWKCSLQHVTTVSNQSDSPIVFSSRYPVRIRLMKNDSITLCDVHTYLYEYGQYNMTMKEVSNNGNYTCHLRLQNHPRNSNIPIYIGLALIMCAMFIWMLLKWLYTKYKRNRSTVPAGTEQLIDSDLGVPTGLLVDGTAMKVTLPKLRLRSLDTFRGICLVVMIAVNYGGGGYWFFQHSAWNGLTVADLVFPWFTFIMGTSIALSFRAMRRREISRCEMMIRVIKRTAILFSLGLLINSSDGNLVHTSNMRIPGVLQRLAATYFVVAIMEIFLSRSTEEHQDKWWSPVHDVILFIPQWLVGLALLTVHLCLTFLLPVEDCPTGYLGPGGLHENSTHWSCTGGAAGRIDRFLFGESHIYQHPTSQRVYGGDMPHDPEGILGTITSVFICFLGLQAGRVIICYGSWKHRVNRWLVWAVITGLVGGILCNFSQNNGVIPCNKNLWSLSFVLILASMAFVLLSICYILADVYNIWSGVPFFYTGMNSILVYVCHEIFAASFPIQFYVPATHGARLAMSVWGATFWTIVAIILHKKGIFLAI